MAMLRGLLTGGHQVKVQSLSLEFGDRIELFYEDFPARTAEYDSSTKPFL